MSTLLSSAQPHPERLPVNPRRSKVPAESRKRVVKACNGCNVRRAKCSGGQPCQRCQKASRECIYPTTEDTVTIKRSEYEALLRSHEILEMRRSQSSAGVLNGGGFDHSPSLATPSADQNNNGNSEFPFNEPDAPREGRILQDPHGNVRYLGESSGATFLNHLREFMATIFPVAFNIEHSNSNPTDTRFISALGRYQTHDSRPLLVASADPLDIPSREEARRMFFELRCWTRDGTWTAASGGLYYWTNIDALAVEHESYLSGSPTSDATRSLALINAAFAIACQLNPNCAPDWDAGNGQTFFARARALLGNPLDVASLGDANVLTLLAFYLLNSNRRDASYMYVSVSLHIYLVHGVHRAWAIDEDGKRKFWDAYNLDRWLGCAMGRPAIVSDEAIRLDTPRQAPGLPPPDGLRAHIELSRITHYIAANVYGVSKHTAEPHSTALCIHKALHMLKEWENELPTTLRYQPGNLQQDMAAYDLQMAANHLKVLAVRPWIFDSVKAVTASICLDGPRDADLLHVEEIDLAIAAARQTIALIRQLDHVRNKTSVIYTAIHHAFNAALALELYRILSPSEQASDGDDISLVTVLLAKQLGGNRPFATDCAEVLSDLACMVGKLRERASRSHSQHGLHESMGEFRHWNLQ